MSESSGKSKVPVVEQVAELAMKLGHRHLARYGATTSRHDFTQRQLMTCLILRAYLKTTYRGVLDLLAASPGLRERMARTQGSFSFRLHARDVHSRAAGHCPKIGG
jgi:hypothetical protein